MFKHFCGYTSLINSRYETLVNQLSNFTYSLSNLVLNLRKLDDLSSKVHSSALCYLVDRLSVLTESFYKPSFDSVYFKDSLKDILFQVNYVCRYYKRAYIIPSDVPLGVESCFLLVKWFMDNLYVVDFYFSSDDLDDNC